LIERDYHQYARAADYAANFGVTPPDFTRCCQQQTSGKSALSLLKGRILFQGTKRCAMENVTRMQIAGDLGLACRLFFSAHFKSGHSNLTPFLQKAPACSGLK
jgi:hypothetical protein